ncbi:MAG: BofC C-terminal domain-containing protein [Clostridia bacterium]|nr:BofC C-terminal domain-containing protein [Clostridia bacterium]
MKKTIWIGIIVSIIFLGITAGIVIHVYGDTKIEKATVQQVKEINSVLENQIVVETASIEEKTSPNAFITFETYYSRCGHSKINRDKIKDEEVNKTEDEIKKAYPNWKIKKFNSNEITLYREENSICENHYMIKEKDGYISIYSIQNDGYEEEKETTDISTQYLPEEDIKLLQNGIKVNSESELEQVLSDYD